MFFSNALLFFLIKFFILCRYKTSSANSCFNESISLQIFIGFLDSNNTYMNGFRQ